MNRELIDTRATFRNGSKTFSLAAWFFDREMYAAACQVYAWCRHCDDAIDEVAQERSFLEARLFELRHLTEAVFRGSKLEEGPFREFQRVVNRYEIPSSVAFDLLEGMAMDARKTRYETLADLELYAYRVAGTVGLMMARVMGASDERALFHAKQLGIAMQLTNISRDILADARMGRVYLPLAWLREEGLDPEAILDPSSKEAVARVADRLVRAAEPYYRDGEAGLKYLAFRPALAIVAASRLYRAIGWRVIARGSRAWDSRTVVPLWRKPIELLLAPFRVWSSV